MFQYSFITSRFYINKSLRDIFYFNYILRTKENTFVLNDTNIVYCFNRVSDIR